MKIEHRQFGVIGRKNDKIYKWHQNRKCDHCGKTLLADGETTTPAVWATEEVSVMRGDDIVKIYHPQCFTERKL